LKVKQGLRLRGGEDKEGDSKRDDIREIRQETQVRALGTLRGYYIYITTVRHSVEHCGRQGKQPEQYGTRQNITRSMMSW
jgi:hypothetical protein